MSERYEAELRHALAEGLLSRDEAEALRADAARLGRAPLELLREQGRLSDDTLASLRREVGNDLAVPATPHAEDILTLGPAAPSRPTSAARSDDTLHPGPAPLAPPHGATTDREPGAAPMPEAPTARRPDEPAFPIPGWDHYQPVRFLGQGGMGRVFLAWDPRLRRHVALKLVRDDDAELARRFVSEARAQARVDHEHVCRVYEVGEVQGRVYIAMQYVDGQPLNALVDTLSVEQKARLLREAAEGVHAAHRAGLIHRDIKPSNVLVERTGDFGLRAYVMDFGLARDWKEGVTATGTVLGTPHYMSPEQARGEVARLDRRADVYSLGATLYALLTGQPPIPGDNGLEVLSRIATAEPRPPRALDRDLPADLEAITLKCLEKDRSARYGSARELAEDLGRFLDGEPVLARTGPGYRARKWLRKHRRAAAAASVALLAVTLASGQAVLARREVTQREALARRFTERVERIEAQARYSGTAPSHDTRADREALRARMRDLESSMRDAGPVAMGPGHYALGRGFLALDDPGTAREHLEAAWKAGYQEPRVAYALALVLGHLYQERRLEAERLQDARARESKLREVTLRYRDPALDFLRRSEGAEVPAPEYVAALLAFYEDRPDEALAKLDALGTRMPWFHEAPLLRGDIHLARAARRWNSGDREGARADLDAGRAAYARAADIGRSVPAVHRARARLEGWALLVELYGQGDVQPHYTRGLERVAEALAVAPDSAEAHELEAGFHRRLAEHRARHGGEVEPLLQRARAASLRALDLEPERSSSLHELALGFWQLARHRQEKGQDPREPLREAAAAYERIPAQDRDYDFHTDLGQVFRVWADHEDGVGGDSLPHRERAIKAHQTATTLDEHRPEAWINLGTELLARSSHPRAANPTEDLARAAAALKHALTLNSDHVAAWFYSGEVHLARAWRLRDSGRDARPALGRAMVSYRRGLDINPKLPPLLNGKGTAYFELAKEAWERGEDPRPWLDEALKDFEAAIAAAPAQGYGQNNVGEAQAWRASMLLLEGGATEPATRAARAALQEALTRVPDLPQPWLNLGAVLQVEAASALRKGREPREGLEEATKALRRALALNPKLAQAWRALGETQAVQARWKVARGLARAEDFEEAAGFFQRAVDLEPAQPEHRVAFARFCLEWGAWHTRAGRDGAPVLERGVAQADAALAARSDWPRGRAVRASLLLALSELPGRPEATPERRSQVEAELSRALTDNRHLMTAWGPWPRPGRTDTTAR